MKFSIEFTSMRDFLTSFPKLATLISGDGSPEERFAAALAGELEPMTIKVTPTDGKPLTDSEKEGVKDAIAEALHANRSYLSRLYKSKSGVNLFDDILVRRIELAKEYMRTTDKKMYEISHAVGFDDTGYFSRAFKKLVGVSPREYRNEQKSRKDS